jgi:hypothetical protein
MDNKVLEEIKYMGKPCPVFALPNAYEFALEWEVKDTRRYTGRVLTNWDYECHKIYSGWEPTNFATFYKHNTKKELYKMACDNRIASRSHMKKKDLIVALLKL